MEKIVQVDKTGITIETDPRKIDIVEFTEKLLGIELLEYQKNMLRKMAELPKDSKIVMDRRGRWVVVPVKKEEKK